MGLLQGLPWGKKRGSSGSSSSQADSLQAVVDQQSQQLKRQETELQKMAEALAALTGGDIGHLTQRDAQSPPDFTIKSHPSTAHALKSGCQALSVSSCGGHDCTFLAQATDMDLLAGEITELELPNSKALSRYESTINGDHLTMYAPSVASSNAMSVATSQISNQDQNALAGNVKRLNPKFDLKVKKQAVTRLLKAAATDAQARQLMSVYDGIPSLIDLLQSPDSGCRDAAMNLLWLLSRDSATRRQVAEQAWVEGAVHLLHDTSQSTARAAASLIHNCAVTEPLKAEVAAAGGIPALVRLLFLDGDLAIAAVISAVRGLLTGPPPIKQEVLQAGGVQALVSVLKRGWSKAAQPAIKTLHMLCQSPAGLCDEASVMQTLAAGGIDGLLDLLKTGPPACQAAAAGALRIMAQSTEVQERILSNRRVLPLIDSVRSGLVEGQVAAAATLATLAQAGEQARAAILHAGAAEALVDLAYHDDSSACVTAAALAMLSLAQSPAAQHSLIVAGSTRALVSTLVSNSTPAPQEAAARALTNLTVSPEGKAAVHGLGAVDALVHLAAEASSSGLLLSVLGVLQNLARAPAMRPTICTSASLPALLSLALSAESDISHATVGLLYSLAGKGSDAAALAEAGAIELLLHALAMCSALAEFHSAVSALNRLASAESTMPERVYETANKLLMASA